MKQIISLVTEEIKNVLDMVDVEEAEELSRLLQTKERIFIHGEGRSGLVGKMIAMRLMHAGRQVFVVGETTTPSITNGDFLLVLSGSGETDSIYNITKKAKDVRAHVILVTTSATSKIGVLSDAILVIPAATKKSAPGEFETIQPLGNQFDQSAHLLLDAIIIHSTQMESNSGQEMQKRHSNLE